MSKLSNTKSVPLLTTVRRPRCFTSITALAAGADAVMIGSLFAGTDQAPGRIIKRGGKNYFKIALFVGFSDRDLIEGVFKVPGFTKVLDDVQPNASIINVDSTVGFGTTGTIISGANSSIDYTSKSINQFFGCTGVGVGIGTAEDLRDNETIFGYENGDLTKRIDLRITGVLSELIPITDIKLVNESENVFVKNIGEKIKNDIKNIYVLKPLHGETKPLENILKNCYKKHIFSETFYKLVLNNC